MREGPRVLRGIEGTERNMKLIVEVIVRERRCSWCVLLEQQAPGPSRADVRGVAEPQAAGNEIERVPLWIGMGD
jgi:hypothetical protein